jgi:hypothetical protein
MTAAPVKETGDWEALARRHQVWGWRLLAFFMTGGLLLESMHGFKIGFYLDPNNTLRRELWTLAHAHGTLVALVQLLFSQTIARRWWTSWERVRLCSFLYFGAVVFLPGGFFLGGLMPYNNSDPWVGIWWVPLGALFLIIAALVTASQAASCSTKTTEAGNESIS